MMRAVDDAYSMVKNMCGFVLDIEDSSICVAESCWRCVSDALDPMVMAVCSPYDTEGGR